MAEHDTQESERIRQDDNPKRKPRQFDPSTIEKEKPSEQKPYKTPEQITDEDYKVAPTSADKEKIQE